MFVCILFCGFNGTNGTEALVCAIDCKKDGRSVSASFHYRKVKANHLSMAVAENYLRKLRHLEPESAL